MFIVQSRKLMVMRMSLSSSTLPKTRVVSWKNTYFDFSQCKLLEKQHTIEILYIAVEYNMVLNTMRKKAKILFRLRTYKRHPIFWPCRASYGMSIVSSFGKVDRVISEAYCNWRELPRVWVIARHRIVQTIIQTIVNSFLRRHMTSSVYKLINQFLIFIL